jgi:hypothetical protein
MRLSFTHVVNVVAFFLAMLAVPALTRSAPEQKKAGPAILGKLPDNFVVHAVGTYSGPTDVKDVELDTSGQRVGRAEVIVNVPDRPVVLVLTAYDPTVWHVGRTKETTIAGVIVSGYHAQALIGISKDTPCAMSTYTKKAAFPYFYAYKESRELESMKGAVMALVGRKIEDFQNQPIDGVFHVGDPPKDVKGVVYSDELKIEDYARPAAEVAAAPSGQNGIEKLVKDGKLRPATQADIDAWVEARKKNKKLVPGPHVTTPIRLERTYVVLKQITLPDGLFGAHSRSFIIPDGVPLPDGPRAHNTFHLMDGTEQNPFTEAERRVNEQKRRIDGRPRPEVF